MFQFLLICPLESSHFTCTGSTETTGVPFLASSQTVVINGVPLARVDPISVAMAYVRATFAAMIVFGFMSTVSIIMTFTGERLDRFAMIMMCGLIACFIFGVIGGAITYIIPLVPSRERLVRKYCGKTFGICVDPACVPADAAVGIEEDATQFTSSNGTGESQSALIQELITCRLKIARGIDADAMEQQTDELVDRVDQVFGEAA